MSTIKRCFGESDFIKPVCAFSSLSTYTLKITLDASWFETNLSRPTQVSNMS